MVLLSIFGFAFALDVLRHFGRFQKRAAIALVDLDQAGFGLSVDRAKVDAECGLRMSHAHKYWIWFGGH
jgi:hypothetical protein